MMNHMKKAHTELYLEVVERQAAEVKAKGLKRAAADQLTSVREVIINK